MLCLFKSCSPEHRLALPCLRDVPHWPRRRVRGRSHPDPPRARHGTVRAHSMLLPRCCLSARSSLVGFPDVAAVTGPWRVERRGLRSRSWYGVLLRCWLSSSLARSFFPSGGVSAAGVCDASAGGGQAHAGWHGVLHGAGIRLSHHEREGQTQLHRPARSPLSCPLGLPVFSMHALLDLEKLIPCRRWC